MCDYIGIGVYFILFYMSHHADMAAMPSTSATSSTSREVVDKFDSGRIIQLDDPDGIN